MRLRTPAGSSTTETPSSSASPSSGFTSAANMRSVVVLPAPFGPSSPYISPGATSNDKPSTAVFTRASVRSSLRCLAESLKDFRRPRADMAYSIGSPL